MKITTEMVDYISELSRLKLPEEERARMTGELEQILAYMDVLNALDTGATTKLTIHNRRINRQDFADTILLPMEGDRLDGFRQEYNEMLLGKITGATGSIEQERYMTISAHKRNVEEARTFFSRASGELSSRLSKLDERLKSHIIGQDQAVEAVTAAIRRNRVGIAVKKHPVSFIFVGSTGVGKTELVKCLANELFDSVDSLIRLDMSEYMERHSVSKLIGSPPGYVGYDEAGQLTEKIRRKPYSVILFDELEKAHPDVLNILLQILDDGRITDSQGRVVNFENTVIVMTSNAGSDRQGGSVGFGRTATEQGRDKAMKALSEFLRPEFLNRVDEIICFNRLSEENFRGIAAIMLGELKTALEEHGVALRWDESVIDYLVQKSYTLTYGARNLRRTIQKDIEDVVAEKLIDSYENPITAIGLQAQDGKLELSCL